MLPPPEGLPPHSLHPQPVWVTGSSSPHSLPAPGSGRARNPGPTQGKGSFVFGFRNEGRIQNSDHNLCFERDLWSRSAGFPRVQVDPEPLKFKF